MATSPTVEENASSVLGIYEHFDIPVYGVLRVSDLLAVSTQKGLSADDIDTGIAYCLDVGWLEDVGDGKYLLAPGGRAAIGAGIGHAPVNVAEVSE